MKVHSRSRRLAVSLAVAALSAGTTAPAQVRPGNTDSDLDVDLRDAARSQLCFTGPNTDPSFEPPADPDCLSLFDSDDDGDIDLSDRGLFRCAMGGPNALLPAVSVDGPIPPTTSTNVTLTGSTTGWPLVEVLDGPFSAAVDPANCQFSVDVTLKANSVNHLFVTGLLHDGTPSAPTPVTITHDGQPPDLFIDFPPEGAELTTATTDVAGRMGDVLSGFMGLVVTVNGVDAIVDVGIGNNGTFVLGDVPLVVGANTITAVATDELGNSRTEEITISRVEIAKGMPRMEVVSGNGQNAQIGTVLPTPIVARILDATGAPFANKIDAFARRERLPTPVRSPVVFPKFHLSRARQSSTIGV